MATRGGGYIRAGADYPICILLLIDGSGSMGSPYRGRADLKKIDVVTGIVNDLIERLNKECVKKGELSPRYLLGILAYGDGMVNNVCANKYGTALVDVRHVGPQNAVRKDRVTASTGELESSVEPTWFDTEDVFIDGGTPMNLAFDEAQKLLKTHVMNKPPFNAPGKSSYPLVINITDGQPTDGPGDPFKATEAKMQELLKECIFGEPGVKTWPPVICNVYVSDTDGGEAVVFPPDDPIPNVVARDTYGKWLFKVSMYLPREMARRVHRVTGTDVPKPIGFIWDATAEALLDLIIFMSDSSLVGEKHDGAPGTGSRKPDR